MVIGLAALVVFTLYSLGDPSLLIAAERVALKFIHFVVPHTEAELAVFLVVTTISAAIVAALMEVCTCGMSSVV